MKLSFSVPSSKSHSKPKPVANTFDDTSTAQNDTTKHLITEFDPSKPAAASASETLIPPIQNEWHPTKKMRNLHLPTAADSESLAFERDAAGDEPDTDISYGLNVRADKNPKGSNEDEAAVLRRRVPLEATAQQKFKSDLERLPEDQGMDEFTDTSVEGFAAALLAGYGWKEGMGIGRNHKEDVKVVEIKRRTVKEGLGFDGNAPSAFVRSNNDKDNKNKEKDEKSEKDEKVEKSEKDEKSEKGEKREKEKVVRIVGGRDAGLKGSVMSRIGEEYLVLELARSGEKVKVKVGDVAELGSKEEERCLRKLKELKIQREDKEGSKSKRGRDEVEEKRGDVSRREKRRVVDRRDEIEDKRVDGGRREERRVVDHRKVSWLTSHIRVRVISRDLKGGRLYLKKGQVLDVVGPTTCDISMDENREIVQGVSQDVLETAIPKRGGPVLVLAGKYKGVYGSLVERDLDRGTATVRDADTHELLNVKLEQIAEYTGDPSLLGH